MKKKRILVSFALCLVSGVVAYLVYAYLRQAAQEPSFSRIPETVVLKGPTPMSQDVTEGKPPPPPPVPETSLARPLPEPERTLLGISYQEVKDIEQALPSGARIAILPTPNKTCKAAIAYADLNKDSQPETVIVYSLPSTPKLTLSVLNKQKQILVSHQLEEGTALFGIEFGEQTWPLVVSDLTGDGSIEIALAYGIGASLGGSLQIYSLSGSTIEQRASLAGHFFKVEKIAQGSHSLAVRSRYEASNRLYKWNGQSWTQINIVTKNQP